MKISDIVNKKKETIGIIDSQDNLKQQKEAIEREALQQLELDRRAQQMQMQQSQQMNMQQPQQGFFTNQGQQPLPQHVDNPFIGVEEFHNEQPDPRMYQRPVNEINIKFSIFLENGQKLPISINCPEDKIDMLMESIDQKITDGEIITIGDFKIVGSRILYIDLLGR